MKTYSLLALMAFFYLIAPFAVLAENSERLPVCGFKVSSQRSFTFDFEDGPTRRREYVPREEPWKDNCDRLGAINSMLSCNRQAQRQGFDCIQMVENKSWNFNFEDGPRSRRWKTCWACFLNP